jgi:hypothetical protein
MLLPAYQFHAQRFNANAVLLPAWPTATYCFLRSFESREVGWAIAAGATAALAMLGKYYSVFLIASFLGAAVCHPQRRTYFGSSAPWISTITGLTALAPHMVWLATTGAKPFAYALERHAGRAHAPFLIEPLIFLSGVALVLVIPAVAWALIAGSRLKTFPQDFRAMNPGLLLLFFVSVGTLVLPPIAAAALGADLPPIWALQGLFLVAILMVCGASYPIERFYSVNLAALVIGIAVLGVGVVAPVHAFYRNFHPLNEGRNFYQQSAMELTRQWHRHSEAPLPAVGGDDGLAFAMAFYSPDHPQYEARLVHPNAEKLASEVTFERGWAALCYDGDTHCIAAMERTAARASRYIRSDFVLESTLLGQGGATQGFAALIVPPSTGENAAPPTGMAEDLSALRRGPAPSY